MPRKSKKVRLEVVCSRCLKSVEIDSDSNSVWATVLIETSIKRDWVRLEDGRWVCGSCWKGRK